MKKLVLKDSDGRLTEVDSKALIREAIALRTYIENANPSEEKLFSYRSKLLPIVNAAIGGAITFPYMKIPCNFKSMMEGIEPELPTAIEEVYFQFINRIQGSPTLSSASFIESGKYEPGKSEQIIEGKRYEWVYFED
jgi:hypothetical protein